MRLRFETGDERQILAQKLGLAATATDADVGAAAAQRLLATAPPSLPAGTSDQVINAAVEDGRIPPERAAHYRDKWARDPNGTAALIARLHAVPENLRGELTPAGAGGPDAYPAAWLRANDGTLTRRSRVHGGD